MKYQCLLLLSLVACGGHAQSMTIDSDFTESEVEQIQLALDEWVDATDSPDAIISLDGTFRSPTFTSDVWGTDSPESRVFRIHESDPGYNQIKNEIDSDGFRAIFNLSSENIAMVMDDFDPDAGFAFRKVFMHEIGHLLGLEHESFGVMSSDIGKYGAGTCITSQNVNDFCDMHDCGPAEGTTCPYQPEQDEIPVED